MKQAEFDVNKVPKHGREVMGRLGLDVTHSVLSKPGELENFEVWLKAYRKEKAAK